MSVKGLPLLVEIYFIFVPIISLFDFLIWDDVLVLKERHL